MSIEHVGLADKTDPIEVEIFKTTIFHPRFFCKQQVTQLYSYRPL